MGSTFSRLRLLFSGTKPCRILMVGLDNAGKTTILYKLKLGEVVTTIPTIGFNVETVNYRNLSFTVWDVGGQERIRVLWKYYFNNTEFDLPGSELPHHRSSLIDSPLRNRLGHPCCCGGTLPL
ncbi:hypothetical protein Y032_0126g1357 [Ancylostoma ceylanicum]|nr:hypothetical protein Y032_0126g1357 [Ancylostoma ceylanicum]